MVGHTPAPSLTTWAKLQGRLDQCRWMSAMLILLRLVWGCSGDGRDRGLERNAAGDAVAADAGMDVKKAEFGETDGPGGDSEGREECLGIPVPCGPTSKVDQMIGTGEIGYRIGSVFVGAAAPFGLVKVGPDTEHSEYGAMAVFHSSGYWYPDDLIVGFSHTHLHGTGAPDYGDILVVPTIGISAERTVKQGYSSRFEHDTEVTAPGYYSVQLKDYGIKVEISASTHTAWHRYRFPKSKNSVLLFDVSHTIADCQCDGIEVHVDPAAQEIWGLKKGRGALSVRFGGYTVHFWARVNREFAGFGTFEPGLVYEGEESLSALAGGAFVRLDTTIDRDVELTVGISFVDQEGAKNNLDVETTGHTFETFYAAVNAAWANLLGVVEPVFDTPAEEVLFFTALYHTALMPTVFSDADGRYLGFDHAVHSADWGDYYTDFSLWDTFRVPHPLYVLLWPERQLDMLRSLVAMKEQGGYLPKWALANGYTNCMVGTSADLVVADSYLKGLTDFDYQSAFEGMVEVATKPPAAESGYSGRGHIEDYIALGYMPGDLESGSVSKTQEYAYADYCIARMAAALGETETAAQFQDRAGWYANLWDPATKFFRGRLSDGSFMEPFYPDVWLDMFVEGDAWQYLFYPPHDSAGLAALMGGWDLFIERMKEFFQLSKNNWDDLIPSPYYFHGNEPDIHTPFIFSLAGKPDLASKWVSWIIEKNYANTPSGLPGNDDAGTLSAWYVFSALGFYPIVCTNLYALVSPLVSKAKIRFKDNVLQVSRVGQGPHLQAILVGGAPLTAAYVQHAALTSASTLEFILSNSPGFFSRLDSE